MIFCKRSLSPESDNKSLGHVLALAINNAKSLEPQKIREAILSVKDYPGVEGTYNFDQNGDGLRGYNVVKNDNGKIVFIKHIDFSE